MGTWLDFKELRQRLDFAEVLKHYGVELKVRRGEQHQGVCPLPTHQREKRSRSFSANLKKGVFKCFSCQAQGDVLSFVTRMEGLDPGRGADIRKAAILLSEQFRLGTARPEKPASADGSEKLAPAQQNAEQAVTCPAIVNAPLDFTLKGLDSDHPYLKGRGFTPETITHFGIGYVSRGFLQGRIAIPVHDSAGRLVGYAGRLVDHNKVSDANPKYKFPAPRDREGKRYEFHRNLLLYNFFSLGRPVSDLVVCEGFASVWWLWQHGHPNTVALMGSSCSEEQGRLIVEAVRPDGHVWLLPDGDSAGELCAESVLKLVCPHRFVHWVRLENEEQPTDCTGEELSALLRKGGDYGPV